jgi:hypothetical protein
LLFIGRSPCLYGSVQQVALTTRADSSPTRCAREVGVECEFPHRRCPGLRALIWPCASSALVSPHAGNGVFGSSAAMAGHRHNNIKNAGSQDGESDRHEDRVAKQ